MTNGYNTPIGVPIGLPSILSLGLPPLVNPYPTLNLDFIENPQFDSRITFSRGSQATLFDSTGTLVYAKHNLVLQSQDFTTTWTLTGATLSANSAIAPDGTVTAEKIIPDSGITVSNSSVSAFTRQDITKAASAITYSFSLFAKAGEFNAVRLFVRDNATSANNAAVTISLVNGTVLTAAAAAGTFTNASATAVDAGNGWYRAILTFTTGTETTIRCIYAVGDSSSTTGDGVKGIFIWGAELNFANMEGGVTSSLTTYYPTTTAAYYAPRFDYNPSTLQPLGLLIEEQRTNLFPASNDFANATYWTVYGTAVATAGAGTGPDGLNSAVNLAGATDITLSGNNIEEVITVSASTAYGFSVFVKSNGGTTVTLRLRDSTGGSTSSSPFTVTSSWTRISLNRTMAVGATSVRCIIGATDGDILIYGAQLEAGAFATSYIPTTTTALTRNADVASMTGTNFSSWYNQTEGTIFYVYGDTVPNSAGTLRRIFAASDGTSNNLVLAGFGGGGGVANANITTAGASQTSGSFTATMPLTNTKATFAFKANDVAFAFNGNAPVVDNTATIPSTISQVFIGSHETGGTNSAWYLNGHLQQLTFYPTRLPNATLVALTA